MDPLPPPAGKLTESSALPPVNVVVVEPAFTNSGDIEDRIRMDRMMVVEMLVIIGANLPFRFPMGIAPFAIP
jgi:hypothetical protein